MKLDTSVDKRLGNHEQVIHELQEETDHLNNEVKVHQQTLREKEYDISTYRTITGGGK